MISATVAGLLNLRGSAVEDLAAEAHIAQATLYRKLRGGRWKATEAKMIADAFKVPVGDLYDGKVTPGPALPKCPHGDSNSEPTDYELETRLATLHVLRPELVSGVGA